MVFRILLVKLLVLMVKKEIPLSGNLMGKDLLWAFSPRSHHLLNTI